MIRILLAMVMLAFTLDTQANEIWPSLWRNADQRGEALLQQGDAAAAVKVYADPRRKAYAELKAADYAAAARDFSGLDDSEARYNQGNALAFAGDLKGALDAYDAALKHDPNNHDARHNRDLVANALKQKPPEQQNANGGKSSDGKQAGKSGTDQSASSQGQRKSGDRPGQAEKNQSDKNSGNGDKGNTSNAKQQEQSPEKPSEQTADQAGAATHNAERNPQDKSSAQQDATHQNNPPQDRQHDAAQNGEASSTTQERQHDDANQARRDAAASVVKPASKSGDGRGMVGDIKDGNTRSASAPLTEKQLAQDQWLRAIPDDPGGLLRRKFLIEHMLRQQKEQP